MTLRVLLDLYAAAAAIFCMNFIAAPTLWIALYGADADPQTTLLVRLVGALFGGLTVMADRERHAPDPRGPVVLGLVVSNGFATLVALSGLLSSASNPLVWIPVVLFGAFTVGFLGFSLRRRQVRPLELLVQGSEMAFDMRRQRSTLRARKESRLAA